VRISTPSLRSNGRASAPLLCTLSLLACDPEPPDEDDEDDVELRAQMGAMKGNYELAQDGSHASRATASVEINVLGEDGKQLVYAGFDVRGTCGATFISPHYAITAAHCASETLVPDTKNNLVHVTNYDITGAQDWHLLFLGFLDGFYPDYVPWVSVDDVVGYESKGYDCSVVVRCGGGSWGTQIDCNSPADVAMLHCPDRADDGAWLEVAQSDPGVGPVEMYWFHEVLDMPMQGPGFTAEEQDRVKHYVEYNGNDLGENYHYLRAKVTLMPLRSIPWESGAERTRTGSGNWTDLYGCHGTSGSGVLQRNDKDQLELLGPVTQGNMSWQPHLLCTDVHPEKFYEGMPNVQYASNSLVREIAIQQWPVLGPDRLNGGVYEQ
jgi:hypothetical protein